MRGQQDHPVIQKIRRAEPLTGADLEALEVLLFPAGDLDSMAVFEEVYGQQENLASFIRSLVGLDRSAAQAAFARFLDTQVFSATQIRFVEHIIERLSRTGRVPIGALFEPPFTNANPPGLDGVCAGAEADQLLAIVRRLDRSVIAV